MSKTGVDQNYKEKLDMPQIVFKQIDRTNHAASYDYDNSTRQKINNLPMKWATWVKIEQSDRYTIMEPQYEFLTFCGLELGSIEAPLLDDETKPVRRYPGEIDWSNPNIAGVVDTGDEDYQDFEPVLYDDSRPVSRHQGEIDWSDPNIISPTLTQAEYIDYSEMDLVIMEAYEYAGLTWQTETVLVDGGDTVEEITRKKTPYRMPSHIREETQQREEDPEDE